MALRTFLSMMVCLGQIWATVALASPPPNILYLYADDLGWGTIRANSGSETLFQTPTIDTLATGGINFRRAYGCMVCSPARSSQQTGFHQGHTWTDRNDPDSSKAMREDDKTIGDLLNGAGYRVGYYGKWGYGADSTKIDPAINNPQTLPINHGYTDLLAELHHVRAHTFFQESLWFNNIDTHGTSTVLQYNANTNNQKLAYADDLYAEAAEAFIRTHANGPKPFLALIAFQVPHTPLADVAQMPDWFAAYEGTDATNWPSAAKQYAAMLNRQDGHIADLLAALDDPNGDGNTNDSVRANTLVIFSSDNGGQGNGTYDPIFETNGNLSGNKGSVKEGGIRVPTIFNWQGVIAPGQSTDHITCVSDVLPTLCELAGVVPPVGLDGVSIAPLLTGRGQQRVRPWFTHESGSSWSLIRRDGYKLRNNGALYYLADGSNTNYESNNISGANPLIVAELQAIAMAERVTEPDAFANTYHHWTGTNGANVSDAGNWSDYDYANNGTSYVSDNGPPRESWNATLANTGAVDQTAMLDADISTLGIDIAGNTNTGARQVLSLAVGKTLTGRNEVRLSSHATVALNGGALASTRWVDVFASARLEGPGTVDAILYNAGTLDVTSSMTTITTNVSGGVADLSIQLNRVSNTDRSSPGSGGAFPAAGWVSTDGGATTNASAVYDVSTFIADNVSSPQTLAYTVTGLDLDSSGGNNDQILIAFRVNTDGQNLQTVWNSGTSQPENAGWLSSGGSTLDANGEYVQFSNTLVRVDLNGGTGNGTGSFLGFSHVGIGAFAAGEIAMANGNLISFDTHGRYFSLTQGGLDPVLQVLRDNTQGTSGAFRPEAWSVQVTTGDPSPPVTNIIVKTVHMVISNDYHQAASGLLIAPLDSDTPLVVHGTATLAGHLECILPPGFNAAFGDRFTIISADSISGTFNNAGRVVEKNGHYFRIHYSDDTVQLEKIAAKTLGMSFWLSHNRALSAGKKRQRPHRDTIGVTVKCEASPAS